MIIISEIKNVSNKLKGHLHLFNEYVRDFNRLSGCYSNEYNSELSKLRDNLFLEEYKEFVDANGKCDRIEEFDAILDMCYVFVGSVDIYGESEGWNQFEIEGVFHEQAQLIQECILQSAFGKKDDFYEVLYLGFMEVHRSNMSKFFPRSELPKMLFPDEYILCEDLITGLCCFKDANAKVRKPGCYFPPNLGPIVEKFK